MNKKTIKITLISILISSTLFNMTNNTLASTEDDIEENIPEEYIKEQSEGDEFEESTYESEPTTETLETYNQKSMIEDAAGEGNGNEENSSVPEQETYKVKGEESELDENAEVTPNADQEPVDEPATETEADNNLLVPEENHDETTPEDSQEEPELNDGNDTDDNGGTEDNPEDVPEDNTEESVNDNNDNNQSEQENQGNIDNGDDVDNDTPIDDDPVDLTPGAGENNDDTGDINGGSGSGDNDQDQTEEDQQTGNNQGNTGNGEPGLEDNDYQGETSDADGTENDYPTGDGGSAAPNAGEVSEETPDAAESSGLEEKQEDSQGISSSEAEKGQNSGVAGKKLYHYNYGDILNGIDFKPGMTEENYSTLDKRINRIMTSKIVGEKDMTDEEILEIEEEIKNESGVISSSSDRDALPNTGDTNQYNFIYSFVLILAGGILFFLTKRPENDQ